MSHFAVSIVIPVWNEWHHTKNCLDVLRSTLGVHDEVIIVDNGSRDETPNGLKNYSWVKVITNEENRGFAPACNQGAAIAQNEIVIFLNNDTIPPARWIDGLVWPFEDPTVGATGPRSDFVTGPQMVPHEEMSFQTMSEYRRLARKWRDDHRGQTSKADMLIGFCFAIRRELFAQLEGFDEQFRVGGCEDTDLSMRITQAGYKMLICHESFVHHVGHATFNANGVDWMELELENKKRLYEKHGIETKSDTGAPLLSACMIIKDEIDNLNRCLTSLNGLVDEVIIYDTGSTDGSIEFARKAGATVIEGYWDDDFGRARNAALEACNGDWILQIDADEVFEGQQISLRDHLMYSTANALQVEILNLSDGNKNDLTHRPCRLFKRNDYHWTGRLHEQVTPRDGSERTQIGVAQWIRLIHYGYMQEAMEAKNKAERNIRIAEADATMDDGRDVVDKMTNLGRSLTLVGRNEEAMAIFNQALPLETNSLVVRRTLLRAGAQCSIALSKPEETMMWCTELEKVSQFDSNVHYFRGMAYTLLGESEKALEELSTLDENMQDDDGVLFPLFLVQVRRAMCFASLGEWEKAADEITPAAREGTHDEPIWALVIDAYWRTNRSLDAIFSGISDKHLNAVFAQMLDAPAEAADMALEGLWKFEDRRSNVLALAIRVAQHLPIERALEWSNRTRQVGLSEHCPLVAIAWNTDRSAVDRINAIASAHAAFEDERASAGLDFIAGSIPEREFKPVLGALDALAPELLMPFVLAVAKAPERAIAIGRLLHELGADEEGVAVVLHGVQLGARRAVAEEAAQWLESVGHGVEAAELRQAGR